MHTLITKFFGKNVWNKYAKLENFTARAASTAEFFGPATRRRRHDDVGAGLYPIRTLYGS